MLFPVLCRESLSVDQSRFNLSPSPSRSACMTYNVPMQECLSVLERPAHIRQSLWIPQDLLAPPKSSMYCRSTSNSLLRHGGAKMVTFQESSVICIKLPCLSSWTQMILTLTNRSLSREVTGVSCRWWLTSWLKAPARCWSKILADDAGLALSMAWWMCRMSALPSHWKNVPRQQCLCSSSWKQDDLRAQQELTVLRGRFFWVIQEFSPRAETYCYSLKD